METVFGRLKAWRFSLAVSLNVPSFFILSNAHLAHIALVQPATLDELAACPGLGPKKMARFGEALLAELATCAAEGLDPGVVPPPVSQPEPLSQADEAEILAGLRRELARRVAREFKGRFTADQIEALLARLAFTA